MSGFQLGPGSREAGPLFSLQNTDHRALFAPLEMKLLCGHLLWDVSRVAEGRLSSILRKACKKETWDGAGK